MLDANRDTDHLRRYRQLLPFCLCEGNVLRRVRVDDEGLAVSEVRNVESQREVADEFKAGLLVGQAEGEERSLALAGKLSPCDLV
jgi:hypothetical protein